MMINTSNWECRTNYLGYRQYYDERGDERCPVCGGLYTNEGKGSIHPKCADILDLNDVEGQDEDPGAVTAYLETNTHTRGQQ